MKQLNMNTKELLIGLIFGDGYISKSDNKSFITFEKTTKHSCYVLYLHDTLIASGGVSLYPVKYYTR